MGPRPHYKTCSFLTNCLTPQSLLRQDRKLLLSMKYSKYCCLKIIRSLYRLECKKKNKKTCVFRIKVLFPPPPPPNQKFPYQPLSSVMICTHEASDTPSCSSFDNLYSCKWSIVNQCSILHWPKMDTNRDYQESNLSQQER